jgi:hypothetical protein
MEEVGIKV